MNDRWAHDNKTNQKLMKSWTWHILSNTYTLLGVHEYLMCGDCDVSSWVCHAGQHKSILHLSLIKERLITLVYAAGLNLASTARACTSTATVRQVKSSLLRCVQDVCVLCINTQTMTVPYMPDLICPLHACLNDEVYQDALSDLYSCKWRGSVCSTNLTVKYQLHMQMQTHTHTQLTASLMRRKAIHCVRWSGSCICCRTTRNGRADCHLKMYNE